MKKFITIIMLAMMVFTMASCKSDKINDVEEVDSSSESAGLLEVDTNSNTDGVLDFKDFTMTAESYEFSKKEELDEAAVYTYLKNDDYLDVSQEGFEWTQEDFDYLAEYNGKEAEYGGIKGYTAEPFDGIYSFVFNLNGRAWQIMCSNETDLNKMLQSIKKS